MSSKTFDEILKNASPEDRAVVEKAKAIVPQGQEATETPTQTFTNQTASPSSVPTKAPVVEGQVNNSPVTGTPPVSNPDAVKQAGQTLADNGLKPTAPTQGSSTFSEIASKPTTATTPPQQTDTNKLTT